MSRKYKLTELIDLDSDGCAELMNDPSVEIQDIPYGELEDMDEE